MRKSKSFIVILLIVILFVLSCDDDSPSKPNASDLIGTWVLTKMTVGGNEYNPVEMGFSVTIIFNSDGTFQSTEIDGEETTVDTGTWSTSGNTLTITSTEDGVTISGPYSVAGNKLTITITDEEDGELITYIYEFTKQ